MEITMVELHAVLEDFKIYKRHTDMAWCSLDFLFYYLWDNFRIGTGYDESGTGTLTA
jgi:hypothetical protein